MLQVPEQLEIHSEMSQKTKTSKNHGGQLLWIAHGFHRHTEPPVPFPTPHKTQLAETVNAPPRGG